MRLMSKERVRRKDELFCAVLKRLSLPQRLGWVNLSPPNP